MWAGPETETTSDLSKPPATTAAAARCRHESDTGGGPWRRNGAIRSAILDGLRWVRSHIDPGLAFRYPCLNANACKERMMLVDGKASYACKTRLEPRQISLTPLPHKPLLRDLATVIAAPDERVR